MMVAVGSSHPPSWLTSKPPAASAIREPMRPTTASTVWNAA